MAQHNAGLKGFENSKPMSEQFSLEGSEYDAVLTLLEIDRASNDAVDPLNLECRKTILEKSMRFAFGLDDLRTSRQRYAKRYAYSRPPQLEFCG